MFLRHGGALEVGLAVALAAAVLWVAWTGLRWAARPAGGLGSSGPGGTTDYAAARTRMVDALRAQRLIASDRVAEAMRRTERHLFVPEDVRELAYVDTPLPIGEDQTISAPSVVALMTEELRTEPDGVVLEVGTGSGYQAAVLAPLVSHVYSIEIVPALAATAEARLHDLGYENVTVRCGDGYQGWPEHAPFEGIIVTCAPDEPPQPLLDQLKEGGRMVIPVGEDSGPQWLCVLTKRDGLIEKTRTVPVRFVPMTGEAQRR